MLLVILPHILLLTADLLDIFLFFQIILLLSLTYSGPVILGLFMQLAFVVDGVWLLGEVAGYKLVYRELGNLHHRCLSVQLLLDLDCLKLGCGDG